MAAPLEKEQVIHKINSGQDKNKKRLLKILGKETSKGEKGLRQGHREMTPLFSFTQTEMDKVVKSDRYHTKTEVSKPKGSEKALCVEDHFSNSQD